MSERVAVRKTYKLFIGGKFPRSESGRSYIVQDSNVSLAARKDARDAVLAARAAVKGWSGATAYNRGQILYRVAEMLEGRREQFVALGVPADEVDAAIDRWVWYAGWADKLAQVYGGANPVAGPYFNLSAPEPTGASTATTPVGSGVERLKKGPATGLALPTTWASLSAQPAYQTSRSTAASTAASACFLPSPSERCTSSTNCTRRPSRTSATR